MKIFQRLHCNVLLKVLFVLALCVTTIPLRAQEPRLIGPVNGKNYQPGDVVTLEIGGMCCKHSVRIEFSSNGGKDWELLEDHKLLNSSLNTTDTSFSWVVPSLSCEECLLRVRNVKGELGRGNELRRYPLLGRTEQYAAGRLAFGSHSSKLAVFRSDTLFILDVENDDEPDRYYSETATKKLFVWNKPTFAGDDSYVTITGVIDRGNGLGFTGNSAFSVWNIDTKQSVEDVVYTHGSSALFYVPWFLDGDVSDDGKYFVASFKNAFIWDIPGDSILHGLSGISGGISVDFRPNSQEYTLGDGYRISIWRGGSTQPLYRIEGTASYVEYLYGGDSLFVFSDTTEMVRILDPETGDTFRQFNVRGSIRDVADHGSRYVAQKRWKLWDPVSISIKDFNAENDYSYDLTAEELGVEAFNCAISADGGMYAIVTDIGEVIVYDISEFPADTLRFSISSTLPEVTDRSVGEEFIGNTKDTILTAFVANNTTAPIEIEEVSIITGDVLDFMLTSGTTGYTLAPGESAPLGMRFTPTEKGERRAQVRVITTGGEVFADVMGMGVEKVSSVEQGTDRYSSSLSMHVHPNPMSDHITISYSWDRYGPITCTVYNTLGNIITQFPVEMAPYSSSGSIDYEVSNLPPGVYRIELRSGEHIVGTMVTVVR